MLCALIMAGGKGERFWPLSTDERPKQFLSLLGEKTMIQMTVDRLKKLIPIERIFVVTGEIYKDLVLEQLPELPEKNIILEPIGRNTAPCITLSALYIKKEFNDAVIAVLPSDHLIKDDETFLGIIKRAENFVNENPEAIVTIGISPDRPETGYGYIRFNKEYAEEAKGSDAAVDMDSFKVLPVEAFVEKPSRNVAEAYIKEGNYLWNGGMFIWSVNNILKLTKRYLCHTYDILTTIDTSSRECFIKDCFEKYPLVDNISVDYGIMEKAQSIYVIPGDFGWDDVGSWFAVERHSEKDAWGNVLKGEVKALDCKGNLVVSSGKPIVMVGVENMLVVESEEVIFVCTKDQIDNLRDIKNEVQD
ncbi:mannose-1-phosphate guanylyltransferase [Clostridium thermarum]|uniref:mannose-1-phosphate guanylyltransferase n=1 Tax=Clostridium thermarum TaxID=1716543 RepID=UPI0013CF831E|nr:mannose-1-phosphate guanylyltransferase [Clostridium thermarum]